MSRPFDDPAIMRLKAATRDLVKACGGVVRAGDIVGASKTEVSRWQTPNREGGLISLTEALDLELECGLPLITEVLADLNGRRLSDPVGSGERLNCLFTAFGETMRVASTLMAEGAVAMADGKVTPSEVEILIRCASELNRQLASFLQVLADAKARSSLRAV